MPEVLNGALYTRDYNFIKSPLVTNNISNIPGKKGLLFAEGVGHEVRRGITFRMRKLKDCCPGFNLGEWECPRGWQRWRALLGVALAVAGRRRGSSAHQRRRVQPALPASAMNSVP